MGWFCNAGVTSSARLTDANQSAMTIILMGSINWTLTWLRPDGPMSYADFAKEVVQTLERGLQ
jgi:hypothetical protein